MRPAARRRAMLPASRCGVSQRRYRPETEGPFPGSPSRAGQGPRGGYKKSRLDAASLRLAFTRTARRTLRKSDGTAVIEGRRFEVPNRYRHLALLEVRFAAWDLTQVHLVDPHTGTVLCRLFPQDKTANASGLRRGVQPVNAEPATPPAPARIGPLLARMIDRQAATGLAPAYLPKDEGDDA